jgi:dTDP-4-dehydrorhamnose 3,5-epimerase
VEKLLTEITGAFNMPFIETGIPGLVVFEPKIFEDSRGYFFESYSVKIFSEAGINETFVQDNQSNSSYGVIRALHYQLNPYAQAKLIRAIDGEIFDAVIDIRKGSPTYGKQFSIILSAENKKQLFIPVGFAHGFSVLSKAATIHYKCTGFYNKESEGGIRFDDPAFNIDWRIPKGKEIISEKDAQLPFFENARNNFEFKG